MESFTLRRTGQPPLAFKGEPIAEVDGRYVGGQEQNRWHELALYRTEAGRYVLAIAYRTIWQGESDHHEAHHAESPSAVLERLRDFDPLEYLVGYPPGRAHEAKQERLRDSLQRRWETLISDLYEDLPVEWAEEVA